MDPRSCHLCRDGVDLSNFSHSQREVVQAGDGPLSVLAGPGSGKTTGATRFPETMFSTTTLNLWGMGS